ncbi:MAG: PolC-type DNA polymerase III, partial [Oscillospiraceae bacterium]
KIKYMFPKAHAVAYLIAAIRLMWFKVYHPLEFYATYFTVRGSDIDYEAAVGGFEVAKKHLKVVEKRLKEEKSNKDEDILTSLQIVCEMLARGYEFAPIKLGASEAKRYIVTDGKILLPYISMSGIGETAALSLEKAGEKANEILSVDEFQRISGVSNTVIDQLYEMGVLSHMPKSNQVTFF